MAGKIAQLKGSAPVKQPELQVQSFDGLAASLLGYKGERYNPDMLAARKGGLNIYRRMRIDEQVKAVLKFKRDAIIGRGYEFVFEGTQLSPEEQKLRRRVMGETTRQMDGAFADGLTGILTGMDFGFSITEFVTQSIKVDDATYVGLAKLLTRDAREFKFFTDDYGTLTRFVQSVNSREVDLDYSRFVHYVQNPHEDPYYGRSELEAAYRPWFLKDLDLKFWASFKERMAGGFLAINLGASGITPGSQDYAALQGLLSNMRSAMGVLLPNGVTAELHMPTNTDAYEKAIQFHDLAIAKALLIPNLLGLSHTGQTGSYSQSATQLEAFFMTLATDTQRLEQCLNAQLFRPLALQNWDDGEFPRFRFKKASEEHVKNVIGLWKELSNAGAVIATEKDEAHLRELLDFPERDEGDEALAKVKQDLVPIQVDPNKAPPVAPPAGGAPQGAQFSEWDESKHPRHQAGDSRGGEFAPKISRDSSEDPRELKITPEVLHLAEKDLKNAPAIIQADLQEDAAGVLPGKLKRLDRSIRNGDYTQEEIFSAWSATREALRAKYGNEVVLWRADAPDSEQTGLTAFFGDKTLAKRFEGAGRKASAYVVQLNDMLAIYSKNGYYEVVVRKPAAGFKPLIQGFRKKTFSLDSALMRVDFAHMAQRAVALEAEISEQASNVTAKGLADLLATDKIADFIAQPDSIQHAELASATVGKLKATLRSGLERAWSTGLNQAMVEVAKARKNSYTQEDRKLRFKNLRNDAADFFDANSFRMAGNLTDGMRAIIQQELLAAVKTGLRPEEVASRIYDRLIRKGFTTLNAVKGNDTREEVIALLESLLESALDTANVPAYLNTLTRTNTFEALNEARFAEFSSPDLADFVVALRYSAILDDRTTNICQELDGHVHVTESKVWDTYRPPNHYNCRSVVYAVTAIDGWDGVESPAPTVQPQEGFK